MLKITSHRAMVQQGVAIRLEGRLAGPWVEELGAYCRQMSGACNSGTIIDLTGVTFIDAEGKALLTDLWRQGMCLQATGCLTRCVVEEITGASRTDES